jgi:signal transduction histidine kinase/DNA-binding response OmpR family regulator
MMYQSAESTTKPLVNQIFAGGGEMGQHIREFDWSKTVLGPIKQWPQSLKTSISIILNSQHPMWIGWGSELIFLYNDAYLSVLGLAKHPWALGKPCVQVWSEIWDFCGPLAEKAFQKGEASFVNNIRLFMNRGNFIEETFYSFSYSPIQDELGNIEGLFSPCTEITEKLLSERRLKTLSELSSKALLQKTIESACASAMETITKNRDDIPFALLYLINSEGQYASLAQLTGLSKDIAFISPTMIELGEQTQPQSLWPLADVVKSSQAQVISVAAVDSLPLGLLEQHIVEALVLPLNLPGQERPLGILITGVNPCRKLDTEYRTFYELVANQVATAIQNAKTYEEEKKRAEMLAEIDRAKTVFFSNVSHEFRTPLTLMLSPLEDALADNVQPLPPQQRTRVELIQRSGLRLLKLVNSLLDFSRIEANRVQAIYEPTDLSRLTADLASVFRSTMEKAKLQLIVDAPSLEEQVYVDKEMWEKIIFNLLSNAFKFTLQGSIQVSLKKEDKQVVLSVQDTGVGIPESELPRVFERFHRIESTQGRSYEGTGIGLALIYELVKLHGGTIRVESQLGQGSCFTVILPLGTAHLPSEKLGHTRKAYRPGHLGNAYVEEAARWLPESPHTSTAELKFVPNEVSSSITPSSSIIASGLPTANARILLADDNADMRQYVKSLLEQQWTVEAVEDGEAALQSALANPPDLILSDVMMPKLDGFGLLKALRQDTRTQVIPILLLSARAGEEAKIEGLQAGADDYLVKPFSARELFARVESHLKITQIRKAAFQREQELLIVAKVAQADLEQVLSNLKDGFSIINRQWEYVYVNDQVIEFINKPKDALLGHVYWDLFPDVKGTSLENDLRTAMDTDQVVTAEFFYLPHERWYENRIYPQANGISLFSTDITPRKRLEQERQQAIELANEHQQQRIQEAEDYRHKQADFIDTLCHELRNPLNGIYGGVALIEDYLKRLYQQLNDMRSDTDAPLIKESKQTLMDLTETLKAIDQCAQQQKIIVDDVLDLSKLENNKMELNPTPFHVSAVIRSIQHMFQPQLQQRGLQLTVNLPDDIPGLKADQHRLTQVLINVVSNAIKFTATGSITIAIWLDPLSNIETYLNISVTDTGIGMTLEEQTRLFDRFAQASRRTSSKYGGSGLGLAISKQLVKAMGGDIQVASQKDHGSQFRFTICCKQLSEEEKLQLAQTQTLPLNLSPSFPTNTDQKAIYILIVEDNVLNQRVLRNYLEKKGYRCQVAHHGQEALEKYNQDTFDLIFMDIEMPIMGGLEATQRIREKENLSNSNSTTPIIGLSGNASKEQIQTGLKAGMNAYMTKPYHREEVYRMIDHYVQPTANKMTPMMPNPCTTNVFIEPTELSFSSTSIDTPIKHASSMVSTLMAYKTNERVFTLKKQKKETAAILLPQHQQEQALILLKEQLENTLACYQQLANADIDYITVIQQDVVRITLGQQPYPENCLTAHINLLQEEINKQATNTP